MGLPLSRTQIDKLGERLRKSEPARPEDLALLEQLLRAHAPAMTEVATRLKGLGLAPTTRLKTRGTLIDKLRRQSTIRLTAVQDIAGARVVCGMTREEQDAVVARLVDEFSEARVVDRRVSPTFGCRAVHVIPRVDGCNVEIQVRTGLQNGWAQRMEAIADRVGRGIRYGEDPDDPYGLWTIDPPVRNAELVTLARHISELIDAHERGTVAADAVRALLGDVATRAGMRPVRVDDAALIEAQRGALAPLIAHAEAELQASGDASADGPDRRGNR
ncbi:MAG TPA: hypothetical protein VF230_02310 [Acidimicrobiales bacterium]